MIAIVPFVWLFYFEGELFGWLRLALFTLISFTDFFDGYFARKYGAFSAYGRFMDPIADKLLVVSALIMTAGHQFVTGPHLIAILIILCREILVSGLREFLMEINVKLPVSLLAKWKTTIQLFAIGWLIVGDINQPWIQSTGLVLLWVAALLTVMSALAYLRATGKHLTTK